MGNSRAGRTHLERILQSNLELTAAFSLRELLHRITAAAMDLTDSETASILLLDEASGQLRFVAATAFADQLFDIPVPLEGSIAGATFLSGEPVLVNDASRDTRHFDGVDQQTGYSVHTMLAVSLCYRDNKIGVLEALNKRGRNRFNRRDVRTLTALAAQATIAITNARLYEQAQQEIERRIQVEDELRQHRDHLEELVLERTNELELALSVSERINQLLQKEIQARQQVEAELHVKAVTDPLTGVYNRRQLATLGQAALAQACMHGSSLAAMMIDADHFKVINDLHGHTVGDDLLVVLSGYLRRNLRQGDILVRYGGEEFVALLPETDLRAARSIATRLLEGVRSLSVQASLGRVAVTVSIGVAIHSPSSEESVDHLVDRADQAMYLAKQGGRDQVVCIE